MAQRAPEISAIRNWIITGASRGIGAAFASQLATKERHLFLCGRDRDDLDAVKTRCEAQGARVTVFSGDLSHAESKAELIRNSEQAFADTEYLGLINNAGFSEHDDIAALPLETLYTLLEVNLRSPLELCHHFIPSMKTRGGGAILNLASVAGFQGVPEQSVYAASKAFLLSFGVGLHYELRDQGIRVANLCPGLTKTAFFANAEIDTSRRFGRLGHWMEPEEVARFGLKALAANQVLAVPHILNKLPIFLQRLSSRKFIAKATDWVMR